MNLAKQVLAVLAAAPIAFVGLRCGVFGHKNVELVVTKTPVRRGEVIGPGVDPKSLWSQKYIMQDVLLYHKHQADGGLDLEILHSVRPFRVNFYRIDDFDGSKHYMHSVYPKRS